jgi:hypothetical protein
VIDVPESAVAAVRDPLVVTLVFFLGRMAYASPCFGAPSAAPRDGGWLVLLSIAPIV